MPRYLYSATYTVEGTKGLIRDGGIKRRNAVEEAAKAIGAKVEAFYFVFGESDVIAIVSAPDNVSATAVSLVVNASGAVRVRTSILLTPQEMEDAALKAPAHRAPGR